MGSSEECHSPLFPPRGSMILASRCLQEVEQLANFSSESVLQTLDPVSPPELTHRPLSDTTLRHQWANGHDGVLGRPRPSSFPSGPRHAPSTPMFPPGPPVPPQSPSLDREHVLENGASSTPKMFQRQDTVVHANRPMMEEGRTRGGDSWEQPSNGHATTPPSLTEKEHEGSGASKGSPKPRDSYRKGGKEEREGGLAAMFAGSRSSKGSSGDKRKGQKKLTDGQESGEGEEDGSVKDKNTLSSGENKGPGSFSYGTMSRADATTMVND